MGTGPIKVRPAEIDAAGRAALEAADQLSALRGGLRAGDFGGDGVDRTSNAFRELAADWRKAAGQMADAVESLGEALRGAATAYEDTEDGVMRGR